MGSSREKKVDVRVVVATNRNLQKMVDEGAFREDLWFRLNVVRLMLPPLRERRSDVPLLAHYFLNKYDERYHRGAKLTESGLKALMDFTWPGNVRHLQHLIERLAILAPNDRIDGEAVEDAIAAMRRPLPRPVKRWRKRSTTRSAGCSLPPRGATRAGPPRYWASNEKRCTANWNG